MYTNTQAVLGRPDALSKHDRFMTLAQLWALPPCRLVNAKPRAPGVLTAGQGNKEPQDNEGLPGGPDRQPRPQACCQPVAREPRCPRSQEKVWEQERKRSLPRALLTAAGQDDHGEELLHTQARPERGEKSKSWVRPFHSPAAPGLLLPPGPH